MTIGASVRRKEDPRLLTGRGCYVDDVRLPGVLHAVIVRSPHAHARILGVDVKPALEVPGVVFAQGGFPRDVARIPIRLGPRPALTPFLQFPLAGARVRYVGEPIAVVVAQDRYTAEDAAELVAVDYDVLPAVTDVQQAIGPGAPGLHEEAQGNLADRLEVVVGEPERALAGAELRIQHDFSVQRHTGVPMETRGLVASFDAVTDLLTVWGPTKVPHFNRRVLAEMLGRPLNGIRFIEPDVGGGFGVRGEFYPEDFLIPQLALRLRRPVKWIEDRREHLVATNHSREQLHNVEMGATRDGRLIVLIDRVTVDMGAYLRTHGVTVPELTAAMLPGPYRIPHYRCEVSCVMTNKTPTGTYRSPGRFEANFVRERMLDNLAVVVGVDPAEIRRRNFIPPEAMPYTVGTSALGEPTTYDTGDYASALDAALRAVDYDRIRPRQAEARARGRFIGIGLACVVEKAGPGPWEFARVVVDGAGRATVYSGAASLGQGVETVLAQICAEELGLSTDDVTVVHGDTTSVPDGVGAWGSRATVVAGSAALLAAREVKRKLHDRGANRPSDQSLSATHVFHTSRMTYPYGTHAAVVELDTDTGQIAFLDYTIAYDVGRAINPALVEGQLVGGLAQGIGGATLEQFVYDWEGQPLATTFMDYLLPTSMEMPRRVAVRILEESPTPLNPLGVKGAGEGGTAGAGAAIANAVADALRPLGFAITDLPLSPDRILAVLSKLKAAG